MLFNQILKISITEEEVKSAILLSQSNLFRDNLRLRHPNVSFDSKIRGYVGEIGLKKWFTQNNITILTQNYIDDGLSIDIDFEYKGKDIELKTSLIPDIDENLLTVFNRRDIKIIKREPEIEKLKGDIHIQIYFEHQTKKKDSWLRSQNIDLESTNIDYLYDSILGKSYLEKTFLFSWIDKETLIKRINSLPIHKRTWSFAMRNFWVCPLKDSFHPQELITYLNRL
jgi:hypothetical protein